MPKSIFGGILIFISIALAYCSEVMPCALIGIIGLSLITGKTSRFSLLRNPLDAANQSLEGVLWRKLGIRGRK